MKKRVAAHPINDLFIKRWSPRALSGDSIPDSQLMSLFEAARWAPSAHNSQPWHFIYAKRNTQHWDHFFNLMDESNQSWAKNAGVLIVVISRNSYEYNNKYSHTHGFDTGAAWQNLALQASLSNLVAHGISGFDYDRAKKELNISDLYTIQAMIAVGIQGRKEDLPQALQKREEPSDRKPLEKFIFEGIFKC